MAYGVGFADEQPDGLRARVLVAVRHRHHGLCHAQSGGAVGAMADTGAAGVVGKQQPAGVLPVELRAPTARFPHHSTSGPDHFGGNDLA
jgi:acyl-coenzyme A thioesterase PaaI-like protein